MKRFRFTINGTDYESEIISLENNLALIEVNGTPYEVVLHRETKESKTPTLVRSEVKEPARGIEKKNVVTRSLVKSPLPGIVTKIVVAPGDKVKKNQVLYCLEAMKMENQIKSDREGTVTAVKVTIGQAVLQEEVIIEMD